ncbi:MAG: Putative nicotinate-nucleotide pyrophosphorylase [Bacteroidetes bacterium 38_7]|nr:MAG: Putative nicotinate-nucleotide pyrophosphorylase [Bacteroidetes bacterium 38_7]HAL64219.1 carboxylating nicotinate-nucleotide diphosphorylase [Bacteroidales bacterium]
MTTEEIVRLALQEDIGEGDYTTLATVTIGQKARARLLVKENGIICGIDIARQIFQHLDASMQFHQILDDGNEVRPGDIGFTLYGDARAILMGERTALNFMQRMSGIATQTRNMVKLIEGLPVRLLDTRKTTPLLRQLEKYAVRIGSGFNHRAGLYDMILIKDNHIDYAGGIAQAIRSVNQYLQQHQLNLKIEIEIRNFDELNQVLKEGQVHRIMLDNFSPDDLMKAVKMIDGRFEAEASGGINSQNIRQYAASGVDFISVGSLTHHIKSLDLSLKADI